MRQVTFYQATSKVVPCFDGNYVRTLHYPEIRRAIGEPCAFFESKVTHQYHDIHRFNIGGVEVFAAFDEKILLMTGLLKEDVDRRMNRMKSVHVQQLESISNTSWIDRFLWLFKPKGVLPNGKRSL